MKIFSLVTISYFITQIETHGTLLFTVSAIVWIGIVCYLILLHTKIKKLEKRVHEKK